MHELTPEQITELIRWSKALTSLLGDVLASADRPLPLAVVEAIQRLRERAPEPVKDATVD